MIQFWVPGVPAPKGSGSRRLLPARCPGCKRPIPLKAGVGRLGPYIESADAKGKGRLKKWAKSVSGYAVAAMRSHEKWIDASLHLEVVFAFARPESHFGKTGLRSAAPRYPRTLTFGDLDKLVRAIGDSLSGIVFDDDSRVVSTKSAKIFARPGVQGGAVIRVWPVPQWSEFEKCPEATIYEGVVSLATGPSSLVLRG